MVPSVVKSREGWELYIVTGGVMAQTGRGKKSKKLFRVSMKILKSKIRTWRLP
jgi:hypothetical protein